MFSNWMWVYQQLLYLEENDKTMDEDVAEQMEWLQIDPHILAGNVGKVSLAMDSGKRDFPQYKALMIAELEICYKCIALHDSEA